MDIDWGALAPWGAAGVSLILGLLGLWRAASSDQVTSYRDLLAEYRLARDQDRAEIAQLREELSELRTRQDRRDSDTT